MVGVYERSSSIPTFPVVDDIMMFVQPNEGATEPNGPLIPLCHEMIKTWAEVPAPPPIPLPDLSRASLSDVGATAVAWAWTARVVRTAEAVLLLHQNSYDVELAPLIRSMIEHAIAIPWVVDKRGVAYQALARQRAYQWELFNRAQAEGWTLTGEAAELLQQALTVETDDDTRSEDVNTNVRQRAIAYDQGKLYQGWLIETWGTHATLMSAEPYFDNDGRLYRIPRQPGRLTPHVTAIALHTAYVTYDTLQPGSFNAKLAEWHKRLTALMDARKNTEP